MAVQELEEGVLAGLLQVLLQRVEVVQLLLLNLSGHFLEEELLSLCVGKSAQFEEDLRAVVYLSAYGVAGGEEEVKIGAAAH
jgi:hypothetical protein